MRHFAAIADGGRRPPGDRLQHPAARRSSTCRPSCSSGSPARCPSVSRSSRPRPTSTRRARSSRRGWRSTPATTTSCCRSLELGGCGGICVASHLVGRELGRVVELVQSGDVEGARALERELHERLRRARRDGQPDPVKAALDALRASRRRAPAAAGRGDRRATRRAALRACWSAGGLTAARVSDPVRIIPLGGLGQIGNNMTRVRAGRAPHPDRLRALLPARRDARRRPRAARLRLPARARRARSTRSSSRTATRTTSARCRTCCARSGRSRSGARASRSAWSSRSSTSTACCRDAELIEIDPAGDPVPCGPFAAEFVRVTHSVPDAVAVALHTDHGTILHTGDYKIDHTPIDGRATDLASFARLGERRRRRSCWPTPRTPSGRASRSPSSSSPRRSAHHPRRARPRARDLASPRTSIACRR